MPRSRHRSSHSMARRCTCGRLSNACTTLCSTGRPDSVAISSRWAMSWRMSSVVSVSCWTPWLRSRQHPGEHAARLVVHHVGRHRRAVPVALHRRRARRRQPLRRPAAAAGVHRLVEHRGQPGVLVVGRQAPGLGAVQAEHLDEHRTDGHVRQDVQRLRRGVEAVEELGERHPVPRHARGASTRRGSPRPGSSSASRARAASGRTGAKPKPQLPIATDVIAVPARQRAVRVPEHLGVVVGVQVDEARARRACRGRRSPRPRRRRRSARSRRRDRRRSPTSPRTRGAPVPSKISPSLITTS